MKLLRLNNHLLQCGLLPLSKVTQNTSHAVNNAETTSRTRLIGVLCIINSINFSTQRDMSLTSK